MDKYIAWNEDSGMALTINSIKDLIPSPFKHSSLELFKSTGKTDIHGNEIYYDFSIVKFKLDCLNSVEEKVGVFHFDDRLLRAYIAVCYGYLIYSSNASDIDKLEIIGNVKENPELIGEGK